MAGVKKRYLKLLITKLSCNLKLLANQQVYSAIQRVKVHSTVSLLQGGVFLSVWSRALLRSFSCCLPGRGLKAPIRRFKRLKCSRFLSTACSGEPLPSRLPDIPLTCRPQSRLNPAPIPPPIPPAPPRLQRPLRAAGGRLPPPCCSGSLRPPRCPLLRRWRAPPPALDAELGGRRRAATAAQVSGAARPAGPGAGAAGGRVRAYVTGGARPTDPTCGSGWGARSAAGSAACGYPHPDSWRRGPPARPERCRSRPAGRRGDAREQRALPQGHGRRRTGIVSRRCRERGRRGSAPSSRGAGGGRGRGVPLWPRGCRPLWERQQPLRGRLWVSAAPGGFRTAAWRPGRGLCPEGLWAQRRRPRSRGTRRLLPAPGRVEAGRIAKEGRRAAQGGQNSLERVRRAAV